MVPAVAGRGLSHHAWVEFGGAVGHLVPQLRSAEWADRGPLRRGRVPSCVSTGDAWSCRPVNGTPTSCRRRRPPGRAEPGERRRRATLGVSDGPRPGRPAFPRRPFGVFGGV